MKKKIVEKAQWATCEASLLDAGKGGWDHSRRL